MSERKGERHPFPSNYHEFQLGQTLQLTLQSVCADSHISLSHDSGVINAIAGGGFFGQVLMLKDKNYVIKTSLPDPWHHLWRTVNWDFEQFPAQYEESMAQMEHLTTRIIHSVLPVVTDGKFYSPDSLGYVRLSSGFGQAIEKVVGRPPRFDTNTNEYQAFKQAQHALTQMAYDLGLEQVGQIHPDNPFGMANLWFDDKNQRWIWLDTIPAIPHRGWVLPFFHFPFHKEVRDRLNEGQKSFNRIHVNKFRNYLMEHRNLFTDEQYGQLITDLNLYVRTRQQYMRETQHQRDIGIAAGALGAVIQDNWKKPLQAPFNLIKKGATNPLRIVFDPDFRIQPVVERMKKAMESGLISDEEFSRSIDILGQFRTQSGLFNRENKILTGLLLTYIISSLAVNAVQYPVAGYLAISEQDLASGIKSFLQTWLAFQAIPTIFRPTLTYIVGKATHTDLKAAAIVSSIPTLGIPYAIPAQLSNWAGSQSKKVWHHTVRSMITGMSKLFPSGGVGSELEAKLWYLIGEKIEGLIKFEN